MVSFKTQVPALNQLESHSKRWWLWLQASLGGTTKLHLRSLRFYEWRCSSSWDLSGRWCCSIWFPSQRKDTQEFVVIFNLCKQFLKQLFRAKKPDMVSMLQNCLLEVWYAGKSKECERESRTTMSRTSCTYTLKCYHCFSVRSAFSWGFKQHWYKHHHHCLPASLQTFQKLILQEDSQALRSYWGSQQYYLHLIGTVYQKEETSCAFCSRHLQWDNSFSRQISHISDTIFKITIVKIFLLEGDRSHKH